MVERTITISDSSVFKALGLVVAVVVQTIGVYNALLAKMEETRTEARIEVKDLHEELNKIKMTIKDREKYIEFASELKQSVPSIQKELNELSNQETQNFRKLSELDRRLTELEKKLKKQ